MQNATWRRVRLAVALLLLAGCGVGPKEEVITIQPPPDPLQPARALLQRYADGQPLASEATSFPNIVDEVRQKDPARADIVEAGFAELQRVSAEQRPGKARAILAKLDAAGK